MTAYRRVADSRVARCVWVDPVVRRPGDEAVSVLWGGLEGGVNSGEVLEAGP